jgi:hypothetical protein
MKKPADLVYAVEETPPHRLTFVSAVLTMQRSDRVKASADGQIARIELHFRH